MLQKLLSLFFNDLHANGVLQELVLRSFLAMILGFAICVLTMPAFIRYIKLWLNAIQPIRDCGPKSHFAKAGTPTLGGVVLVIAALVSTFIFADYTNIYILISVGVMIIFALLGLVDDYYKITKQHHDGIRARAKIAVQLLVSIIACVIIDYYSEVKHTHSILIPFLPTTILDLGILYIPFAMFIVVGASNAVNITDGLDGLVTLPVVIVIACLGLICYQSKDILGPSSFFLMDPIAKELVVLCAAIVGSCLGFLWYNAQPAEIFMGDVGSLALGGAIGIISIIVKSEIMCGILGGLFVAEAMSVIIQVGYFRYSKGKRVFKMAPLHHHFEQIGWSESRIVVRFWIVSIILALFGMFIMQY